MITFGGRPLNTYKGGAQPIQKTNTPTVVDVDPESIIIRPPHRPTVVDVDPASIIIRPPHRPTVVDVDPASIIITPPMHDLQSYDRATDIQYNTQYKLQYKNEQKELAQLAARLKDAENRDGFWTKIFGTEIVGIFLIMGSILHWLFVLFILFIIFTLCVFTHKVLQVVLDVSHKTLDGVSSTLNSINNWSINFGFIGFPKANVKPLQGSLTKPVNDIDKANNSFPRRASELIILILKRTFEDLGDKLPGMFESFFNGFSKVFK